VKFVACKFGQKSKRLLREIALGSETIGELDRRNHWRAISYGA